MSYSMYISLVLATLGTDAADNSAAAAGDFTDVTGPALDRLRQLLEDFLHGPVTPQATAQLEKDLQQALRELGRGVVQWTYNQVEPAAPAALPPHVQFEGNTYRRL